MTPSEKGRLDLTLVAATCALLMLLPLVTTFDDFLTSWVLRLGASNPLQVVVPFEARMVVALLSALGIHSAAAGSDIVVWDRAGYLHLLLISWNCIGWQSLVLLGVSFFTGLRGRQPVDARTQAIVIGILGTVLLNLLRVAAVAALAATWGQTPALLFHDYGGTLLVIAWLFAFWWLAQRWILVPQTSEGLEHSIA